MYKDPHRVFIKVFCVCLMKKVCTRFQAAKDGLRTSYGAISGYDTKPEWDTSRVTDLSGTFNGYNTFNAPITFSSYRCYG